MTPKRDLSRLEEHYGSTAACGLLCEIAALEEDVYQRNACFAE